MEKLYSFSSTFDVFDRRPGFDPRLLDLDLYPPLPVAGDTLVWGFGLLEQARGRGKTELICREVAGGDMAELLCIALALENSRGAYSLREQARIHGLMEQAGILDRAAAIVPLIDPVSVTQWRTRIEDFLSFPAGLKDLLESGLLDWKTAVRARDLPDPVWSTLVREKECLSFSERRLFSLFLWEIMKRDQLDQAALVSLADRVWAEENPLAFLRSLRYPELSAREARFNEIVAGLDKKGVRISPPPAFEGEQFEFRFSCISGTVFQRRIKALREFEGEIDRLFGLL